MKNEINWHQFTRVAWVSLPAAIGIKNTHTSSGFEPDLMKSFFLFFFFLSCVKNRQTRNNKNKVDEKSERKEERTQHSLCQKRNGRLIALVHMNAMV